MRYYPDLMLLFYFRGVFVSFAVRYAHGGDSKPVLQPCLASLTGHGKDRCDVAELFTPSSLRSGSCKAAAMPGGHA